MGIKKIIGTALAVCFVFTLICLLPNDSGFIPTVSADQGDTFSVGDCIYEELADGNLKFNSYYGTSTSVTVPKTVNGKTVTTVGVGAFANSKAESVVVQSNVTVIEHRAFEEAKNLKSVVIQGAVSKLDTAVFQNCESLTSVTLPSTVKTIGDSAFANCRSLKSIVLPDGLTTVGSDAFSYCSSLSSITIPSTVKTIGSGAFSLTPWLETKRAKYSSHVVMVNDILVDAQTTELQTVTVPSSVRAIADGAFRANSHIQKVIIENGVKSIGANCFVWCTNLSSISIPSSVSSIGGHAFYMTKWLSAQEQKDPLVIVNGIVIDGFDCTGKVVIPSTVKAIADSAFSNNIAIMSVTIPGSVKSIGENAFNNCSALTSVSLSSGLTSIGKCAFENAKKLKTINFPSTLKTIGEIAFHKCEALEKIVLPDSVTFIGDYAFKFCSSAKTLKLPNSAVTIGREAFFECDKIESFTVPAKAKLSDYCFFRMRGVKTLTIEEGRTRFAFGAFYEMQSLKTVKLPQSLKVIDADLFAYSGIQYIDIPKSVERIEKYAFSDCKDLITVKLHGVKYISPNRAFSACNKAATAICARNSDDEKSARAYGLNVSYYEVSTKRIFGNNRYGTASEVAVNAYPKGCDTIVIASGSQYADALAGVPLANALNAPILLSTPKGLDNSTMERILDLHPTTAYILGGTGAVPENVTVQLYTLGVSSVNRIAGNNRYQTAVAIADCIKSVKKAPQSLFIASAAAFPDALSASAAAAAEQAAILYVSPNGKFDDSTAAYLKTIKGTNMDIYVIGGTAVIPDSAMTTLRSYSSNVYRLAGANRYATCAAVNDRFYGKFTNNRVCVVTGKDFPDALTAGVYAAQTRSALILADQALVAETKQYLLNKCPMLITAVGGTGAVPNNILSKMVSVIKSGW